MRRSYLISYDIRSPKRWRQVFKIMNGYGEWWQYSVFFATLKDIDRVRMQSALEEQMNLKEDQCLIHELGNDPVAQPKKDGQEQPPRQPTDDEKRHRRIVLALSWLSVECQNGAPHCVLPENIIDVLRDILRTRNSPLSSEEIDAWVKD